MMIYINYINIDMIIGKDLLDDKDIPIVGSAITMSNINYKIIKIEETSDVSRNIYLEKL